MWNITCRQTVGNSCVGPRLLQKNANSLLGQIWYSTETSWKIQSWTGSVDVKWLQISSLFPCIKPAEWLPHYSQFSRTNPPLGRWRCFSSNQTAASLLLIVQGSLVSSFDSWLASTNIDKIKIRVLPFCINAFEQSCTRHKGPGQCPRAQSHALIQGLT